MATLKLKLNASQNSENQSQKIMLKCCHRVRKADRSHKTGEN